MEQIFNVGDIIYLNQNYCDRFKKGHMCHDTPYEVREIKYFGNYVAEYSISNKQWYTIPSNVIDCIKTKRINNINKILENGNV